MATYGEREARYTKVAQSILALGGVEIVPDGAWGSFTQQTYLRATPATQDHVIAVLKGGGYTPLGLHTLYKGAGGKSSTAGKTALAQRNKLVHDRDGMRELAAKIGVEEGVPASTMLPIIRLESNFNPNAVSPTGYKGLGQVSVPSMTDARNFRAEGVRWKAAGSNRFGPLYAMVDPFHPEENLRVAARYMRVCANRMKVAITDVVSVYMAYNIGVGGARNVLAGRPELSASDIAHQAYGKNGPAAYRANLSAAVATASRELKVA